MHTLPFTPGERSVSAVLFDALWDAPVGIALLDRQLRYVRVNPTMARLNGRPIEEHIGRHLEEVAPQVAPSLAESLRSLIRTGEPVTGVLLSGRAEAADLAFRHWLANHYPIRAPSGQLIGVGSVVVEITERKREEERVEELQRLIVGIVGHDLRSPLSAILGAAKLLPRSGELSERQARLVARIESSATRMESIAGDLLDFTRARSAGGIPVTPRPADMDEICSAAIEEAEASVPGCAIQYVPDGDGCGEWDPDRLGQLLGNLLHNALAHGQSGAPVALRWEGGESHVVLRVENRGRPIPTDAIPQLFEPFSRLATSRGRHAGVGLGLFIAREIARAHGGSIEVTSGMAGTVVTVRLPRRVVVAGP